MASENNHIRILVVGDVSGKGIGAAMFMAIAQTVIRAAALEGRSVQDVLCHANRSLYSESMRHMFVTAVYGILDVRTGEFACSNAGHYAPIRLSEDGPQAIERSGGPMLCALREFEYDFCTGVLDPSEALFLFTDVPQQAVRPHGKEAGGLAGFVLEPDQMHVEYGVSAALVQRLIDQAQNLVRRTDVDDARVAARYEDRDVLHDPHSTPGDWRNQPAGLALLHRVAVVFGQYALTRRHRVTTCALIDRDGVVCSMLVHHCKCSATSGHTPELYTWGMRI